MHFQRGQTPNPEHAAIKPFDYHEEGMENPRIDLYAPETFGMEEDMTTYSESNSQPAGIARLKQVWLGFASCACNTNKTDVDLDY